MWEQIVDLAHNEIVAYAGMMLILSAFFLETRDILNSKEWPYLVLMALGSGLLAVRAYLIDCLLYTSPSPRDATLSRMPSSA